MTVYDDGNVKIEIKDLNLTQEDCFRIYVWILTMCGLEIELDYEDWDIDWLDNLGI